MRECEEIGESLEDVEALKNSGADIKACLCVYGNGTERKGDNFIARSLRIASGA